MSIDSCCRFIYVGAVSVAPANTGCWIVGQRLGKKTLRRNDEYRRIGAQRQVFLDLGKTAATMGNNGNDERAVLRETPRVPGEVQGGKMNPNVDPDASEEPDADEPSDSEPG
ncbi:hypothetical protein B0J18DRAFT_468272 [Chaetomium sp. MPI-SDFR-AT-0129]|nr:hypothetical protein B0J18DRAFT_468272 [Chaetomium sp. MPI-SDFR-AT-0129]